MFWKAKPYRNQITGIISPGKIHAIKDGRTLCGKECNAYPGEFISKSSGKIDCQKCLQSIESTIRSAELHAKWDIEARQREAERIEANRLWWAAYDQYLQSLTWLTKRQLVLRRANGMCEGCQIARAVQVHHRSYPRGVLPGTQQWIITEKLFDLVAVCQQCHTDLHPNRDLNGAIFEV